MNHDENNRGKNSDSDLELEARVVAAVLGEASPFELAELDRLLADNPELAVFKKRIEAVHGLVGDATRAEKTPMQLAPDRRAKLLKSLGTPVPASDQKTVSGAPSVSIFRSNRRREWRRVLSVAAGLAVGVFVMLVIRDNGDSYARKNAPLLIQRQEEVPENSPYLQKSPAVASPSPAPSGAVNVRDEDDSRRDKSIVTDGDFPEVRAKPANGGSRKWSAPATSSPALSLDKKFTDELQETGSITNHFATNGSAEGPTELRRFAAYNYYSSAKEKRDQSVVNPLLGATDTFNSPLPDLPNSSLKVHYEANKSLAGTRLKTNLQDAASAISVVTKQFLDTPASERESGPSAIDPTNASLASNEIDRGPNSILSEIGSPGGAMRGASVSGQLVSAGSGGSIVPATLNRPRDVLGRVGEKKTIQHSFKEAAAALDDVPSTPEQFNPEAIQLSPFEVSADKDLGYNKQSPITAQKMEQIAQSPARDGPTAGPLELSPDVPLPKKPKSEPARTAGLSAELPAAKQPVSTFSLHVSDVSFRLAQAALARGEMPDRDSIRPEEFYNAFDYGDPSPAMAEKVSCRIEQSAHPTLQQRNLVRIALKVPATGRGAGQPLRLTVLLDTSGSMEREDRATAVRRAMDVLVPLLGPNDRLTLIGFARQPRLLAEELPGPRAHEALDLLARTPAEGGTNLEEALNLARDLALRHKTDGAQNRIVLLTDGAANLGNADPEKLSASIEALRQQGIAFDACGVGIDGIDDTMLEALTRKGDGRYCVLNSADAADDGFARQLAGAFRPAAQNVKLQVRFNPHRVGAYRLIGFEQHRLKEEDFRNDNVDAAELAAEEAANAVYQIETLPQGSGELGEVYVRFRDTATGQMVERSWTLTYNPQAPAFDRATPTMQLAGVAALMAEKLKGDPSAESMNLAELAPVVNRLRGQYAHEARVQELVGMFEQLRRMESK